MGSIPEPPKEVDISVALSACDLPSVNQHVKNIAGLTEVVASGNDTARLKMLANARSLVHALETPRETMIKHCWAQSGACMEALAKFHEFAKKTNYREPNDVLNSPLQYGYNTKLDCFSHFAANAPYDMQFAQHMGAYRQGRPSWMDKGFYPVKERLLDGYDHSKDGVLLVDVGGSFGHDIDEFRKKYPKAPGRLVVQDLPSVIEQIDNLDAKVERMGHDFFTEQPIKSARAYYMHSVLHINENCIPATGADWQDTGQDIMMLTLVSSKERTHLEWNALLEKVELTVTKTYDVGNGVESLIECELMQAKSTPNR
ncbi:hypothetical protein Brms1b_006278 [Colletotrichum noveboracense]|nr:hypothetical protein Brms1b_006278 [Colletotrichum noveboracense]